jgi:protein-S-isoprenylcysteine O-methyltransferase Ste14
VRLLDAGVSGASRGSLAHGAAAVDNQPGDHRMASSSSKEITTDGAGLLARVLTALYGVSTYLFFLATFCYLIGFVENRFVARTLDTGGPASPTGRAAMINLTLLGLFAVQHTIMARIAFKRWWTRIIPPQIERSTFVLLSTAILALMVWQWRPMPEVVWQVDGPTAAVALEALSMLGWGIVLLSTFLIDHFELFGLRQTLAFALGRAPKRTVFTERSLYRWVRHPLMTGFLVAFWAAPVMTQGHLLFAVANTVYILFGVMIEERTLVALHGADYEDYRRRVPKLLPFGSRPGRR